MNGTGASDSGSDVDQFYRAVATLEVGIEKIASNQQTFKLELMTMAPRVDGLGTRIDVLAAEVKKMTERIHANNNLMVQALDETAALHQAQITLKRALDFFEDEVRSKAKGLERTQTTLEMMIEILESRVAVVRNAVADLPQTQPPPPGEPDTQEPTERQEDTEPS